MHTSKIEIDGQTWRVHHYGDWRGDATVLGPDGQEIRLPGLILLTLGAAAAKSALAAEVIRVVEDFLT